MSEIWLPIEAYPNYEVSNEGRIRSLGTRKRHGVRILKQTLLSCGYLSISLCNDAGRKNYLSHRLICEVFHGKSDLHVNHKNGIKTDNRIENLEWVTRSENQRHAVKTGLLTAKGIKNSQCKLSVADVLQIRKDFASSNKGDLAKAFKISVPTLYDIYHKRSWAHI